MGKDAKTSRFFRLSIDHGRAYTHSMIFIVEDNDAIRETIVAYLRLAGHETREFARARGVLEALEFQRPELIVFDVMLPDGDGFSLAKAVHARDPSIPFLFLTARESESDRITGLELGADDYVVKPFSPRELSLRVEAILRRSLGPNARPDARVGTVTVWKSGSHELKVDEASHDAFLDGVALTLTLAEWNILSLVIRNGRQVTTRERILGEALDYAHDGSERTVNTHMSNLRAKLGGENWIETIRGIGYRFRGES